MKRIEIKQQGVNDINLNQDMYAKAEEGGMTFSQLLETINPSAQDDKLDAFERQCKRFGIVLQNMPEKGIWASEGSAFFQSNQPASRILFPEYLNRVAREAALEDYDIRNIVANVRPVDSGSYRTLYINDAAAQRRKKRVVEKAAFPVTKVSWSERSGTVQKHGVEIQMSYEFVRRAALPIVETVIKRIVLQGRVDVFADAIDIMLNGDDFGSAAAVVSALTVLDTGAGAGTLTYKGYLKFGNLFRPARMNVAIGNVDTILKVILCAKPTADPIQLFSLLQEKKNLLDESITLVNPNWSRVALLIHEDVPADKLIGLDKRTALEQIIEIGADLQETDRIISSQFTKIVLSDSSNIAKIFDIDCKVFDINA